MIAGVTVALFAAAAWAGSSSWSSKTFTTKYTTSNYSTSNTGTHKIVNFRVRNCAGPNSGVTITFVKENGFLPDMFYDNRTYSCGSGYATRQWTITDTGTFHHDIQKPNDSYTWTTDGTQSWP